MSPPSDEAMSHEIGTTLRDARRRLGMEVREVEERTKIRAKYIRALENEDWETLPAPAYIRGFLRTYGQMLGLDGEMLADEYRRRTAGIEQANGPSSSESVLQARRPAGDRQPPSRGWLIAALAVGLLLLLIVIGLIGGGDDPAPDTGGPAGSGNIQSKQERKQQQRKQERRQERKQKLRQEAKAAGNQKVDLRLRTGTIVEVCLVGDGKALIDGQVLAAGADERFDGSKRYRLDLNGGGEARLNVAGSSQKIASNEPISVEADGAGIREIGYVGPDCP